MRRRAGRQAFINTTWLPLLQCMAQKCRPTIPQLAAYLMGQGLREIIHSAVHDVPEQAQSPQFLDALVAMAMSCVGSAETKSATPWSRW